jgi:hypothetical protein
MAGKYAATDTGQANYSSGGYVRKHGRDATQAEQQEGERRTGPAHRRRTAQDEAKAVKLYYANARSLKSKINELRAVADDQKPDIILICESWTSTEISNAELEIDGYSIETDLRKDREDTHNGIGGGLIIYSKRGIKLRKNDRFNNNNFNQFSSFIVMSKSPVEITLVYRPPNSGTGNLEELCKLISTAPRNSIFIGDFNTPEINWKNEQSVPKYRQLLESVQEAEMVQLIDFSTHDRGNILDLVITNCCERIINVEDTGKLGNSDHCSLTVQIQVDIEKDIKLISRPDWWRADFETIRTELSETNWDEALSGTAEQDWQYLKEKLQEYVEKYVPQKKVFQNQRPRWLNREIIKLLRRKRAAWKDYRIYGTTENSNRYKQLEKEVKSKIQKSKRRMEKELSRNDDKNNKKFAMYIKSKTKSKRTIGPLKNDRGQVTYDNKEMASILNNFFASVFTRENLNNMPEKERETDANLSDIEINVESIIKKINKLRKDSATGPDNIHPHLMKETKNEIAVPYR